MPSSTCPSETMSTYIKWRVRVISCGCFTSKRLNRDYPAELKQCACNKTGAVVCNQKSKRKFGMLNVVFICKMSPVETDQPSNFSLCSKMKPWARCLRTRAEVHLKEQRQNFSTEMMQNSDWLHAGRNTLEVIRRESLFEPVSKCVIAACGWMGKFWNVSVILPVPQLTKQLYMVPVQY